MTTPPSVGAVVPAQRGELAELAAALRGPLARVGTPGYDRLTEPFNRAVAVRPRAVVAAADAYDVVTAVRSAARHGLRVGVQCTGHGATPGCAGDLLVQTSALDECTVHESGWARVGAGVRWAAVAEAAAPLGLAPLSGSSSGVGVVGHTTGGGTGPLSRTYGWASDRVRALDVVTGRGRLLRATADEHADLFWALRGGKGSAGVVTAVEVDLVPLRGVLGGALHFDGAGAAAVLHAWRTWCAQLPEEATTSLALRQLPALPDVPPPLAGRLTVAVRFAWTGAPHVGQALLAPLRAAAPVLLDRVRPLATTALDAVHDDPTQPMPVREAGALLSGLPAEAADALLESAGPGSGSPLLVVELRQMGGALARPAPAPSAVCGRDAAFAVTCLGVGVPGLREAVDASAGRVLAALAPWSTGLRLPNSAGELPAYDEGTRSRLRAVARAHDPAGVLVAGDALFARG